MIRLPTALGFVLGRLYRHRLTRPYAIRCLHQLVCWYLPGEQLTHAQSLRFGIGIGRYGLDDEAAVRWAKNEAAA